MNATWRRIIPARAGFTIHVFEELSEPRDHPRSRGVYPGHGQRLCDPGGSSPLARGLRGAHWGQGLARRIIPARAGFTRSPRGHARRAAGSSPLARGLLGLTRPCTSATRIIPARAGFTPSTQLVEGTLRDHPRSRGVYPICSSIFSALAGSSPLARGLPDALNPRDESVRIIPARAGFTRRRPAHGRRPPDHPRSRGVYLSGLGHLGHWFGSSPLARGLRALRRLSH